MKVPFRKTKTIYGLLLALFVFVIIPTFGFAYTRDAALSPTQAAKYPGVYYVRAVKGDSGA